MRTGGAHDAIRRQSIQLLPAWRDDCTTDFKLHATYRTTVEDTWKNGKVTNLKVTPSWDAMAIGTAGYTAILLALALEHDCITPDRGDLYVRF